MARLRETHTGDIGGQQDTAPRREGTRSYEHREVAEMYRSALTKERVEMAKAAIDGAFTVTHNEKRLIGVNGKLPEDGLESAERTVGQPQIFYRNLDKKHPGGYTEALMVIRMNNSEDSDETTVVVANVLVNSKGVVQKGAPLLSGIMSEGQYNESHAGDKKDLNARLARGELTTDGYKHGFKKFGLFGSLEGYQDKRDREILKGQDRWEAMAHAESSQLLERMRGEYVEALQSEVNEVRQTVEETEQRVETDLHNRMEMFGEMLKLFGHVNARDIERYAEQFRVAFGLSGEQAAQVRNSVLFERVRAAEQGGREQRGTQQHQQGRNAQARVRAPTRPVHAGPRAGNGNGGNSGGGVNPAEAGTGAGAAQETQGETTPLSPAAEQERKRFSAFVEKHSTASDDYYEGILGQLSPGNREWAKGYLGAKRASPKQAAQEEA